MKTVQESAVNAIRVLSADAIQKANPVIRVFHRGRHLQPMSCGPIT